MIHEQSGLRDKGIPFYPEFHFDLQHIIIHCQGPLIESQFSVVNTDFEWSFTVVVEAFKKKS